jgi:hypothetical protein
VLIGRISSHILPAYQEKSDKEFMASHTDDVYGSLLKLSEYVEHALSI